MDTDRSGEISLSGLKEFIIRNTLSRMIIAITKEEVEDIFNVIYKSVQNIIGCGAAQMEEALRNMWGDSMKAANCKGDHITYDNFLLLMKG
eukprot:1992030-Ditylum_brightwellii.AAC.1